MKNVRRPINRARWVTLAPVAWISMAFSALGLTACGAAHTLGASEGDRLRAIASEHRVSVAAGIALGGGPAAIERGAAPGAIPWLNAGLERRDDLFDDAIFRALTVQIEPMKLPPSLRAVWNTERARQELMDGRPESARPLARAALAMAEASVLTKRRAEMVVLLTQANESVDPGAEAYADSIRRIRKQPIPGRLGARLKLRLTMLEAAVHQEKGRFKEAIALYLSVPMDSGMYRSARQGLAWCQFRIGHPERALKILALLPGGLRGDPERAVLAAMAAHALGNIEVAQEIIQEGLKRRPDLEAETVDVEGVLRAVESGATRPLLRGPREGLTVRVASSAEVLDAARALLEFRPAAQKGSATRYTAALHELLRDRVEREAQRQLTQVIQASETLTRLSTQIH